MKFQNSLNVYLKPILLSAIVLSVAIPFSKARADIITDIDQLDPDKKPEKKKDKVDPAAPKSTTRPAAAAKPKKGKTKDKDRDGEAGANSNAAPEAIPPADADSESTGPQPPNKADIIPEPIDDIGGPTVINPPASTKGKGKTAAQRSKSPVSWKSEGNGTYSRDGQTVVLNKNVVINQDDMRLRSDDAKVMFLPKGKAAPAGQGGNVKTATLDGNVEIRRDSADPNERMKAKSDKAIFNNQTQIVTLEGNARLWRGQGNLVQGEKIIYEMATGVITVDRAQGFVQPDRMKK